MDFLNEHVNEDNREYTNRNKKLLLFIENAKILFNGMLYILVLTMVFVPLFRSFLFVVQKSNYQLYLLFRLAILEFNESMSLYILGIACVIIITHRVGRRVLSTDPQAPNRISFGFLVRKKTRMSVLKACFSNLNLRSRNIIKRDMCLTREEKLEEIAQLLKAERQWHRENYACDNESECNYPFTYMQNYLVAHKYVHLVPLVNWATHNFIWSKTFINLLKSRLHYYAPRSFIRIVKMEKNIQKATKVWHVGQFLETCAAIGIVFWVSFSLIYFCSQSIVSIKKLSFNFTMETLVTIWGQMLSGFLPLTGLFLITKISLRFVKNYLHTKRIKEIVYILETTKNTLDEYPNMLAIDLPQDAVVFNKKVFFERQHGRIETGGNLSVTINGNTSVIRDISEGGMYITSKNEIESIENSPKYVSITLGERKHKTILNLRICWVTYNGHEYGAGIQFLGIDKPELNIVDQVIDELSGRVENYSVAHEFNRSVVA